MQRDDVRRAATDAGLDKVTEADLALLARSLEANQALGQRLPKDLHWNEEIAPVLRLEDNGPRGEGVEGRKP